MCSALVRDHRAPPGYVPSDILLINCARGRGRAGTNGRLPEPPYKQEETQSGERLERRKNDSWVRILPHPATKPRALSLTRERVLLERARARSRIVARGVFPVATFTLRCATRRRLSGTGGGGGGIGYPDRVGNYPDSEVSKSAREERKIKKKKQKQKVSGAGMPTTEFLLRGERGGEIAGAIRPPSIIDRRRSDSAVRRRGNRAEILRRFSTVRHFCRRALLRLVYANKRNPSCVPGEIDLPLRFFAESRANVSRYLAIANRYNTKFFSRFRVTSCPC